MATEYFYNIFKPLANYFEPNEYMAKYFALLESNKNNTSGEKHHVIPVCVYGQQHKCKNRKEAEKFANADINNVIVRLAIPQHTLAHFYLCKCCIDKLLFERLLIAFKLLYCKPDLQEIASIDESDVLAQIELAAQERKKDCFGKQVLCIETNTVYSNVSAANEAMGKNRYKYLGIYHACVNRDGQQSALGYHWCFYNNGKVPDSLSCYLGTNKQIEYKNTSTSIYCIETGETFRSAYEAGKHFNVSRSRVLECCRKSWLTINELHLCFAADKDAFKIKAKPGMSEIAKKNISIGTAKAMAKLSETQKQQMREKTKKFWADNNLHYYNNGIDEARLSSCPDGWVAGRLAKYRTPGKQVKCIELNTIYGSMTAAEQSLGISRKSISNCINGKSRTAGGYTWQLV